MKARLNCKRFEILGLFCGALLLQAEPALAQPQATHQHPATNAPASVEAQLNQLRHQVAELARIMQSHGGVGTQAPNAGMAGMPSAAGASSAGGMGMMGMDDMMMGGMKGGGMQGMRRGRMGMMDMDMDMMKGMPMGGAASGNMPGMNTSQAGGMGMMDMMGMMRGMEMMGMRGMQNMNMPSALPGFPGASHLYHIGATGFFLDHPEHITLSTEQQAKLNKVKEQAALAKNTADREIAQAEQELWELTASDQPDTGKIEGKIKEIEKLRTDSRLAFIRSVGEAAKVLTDEQRKILVGQAEPAGKAAAASGHKH